MPALGFISGASPLSPPVFRDERLSDVARLVYWLAAVMLAPVILAPILLVAAPAVARDVLMSGVAVAVMIGAAFVLVRSGRPIAAARVMVVGLWLRPRPADVLRRSRDG